MLWGGVLAAAVLWPSRTLTWFSGVPLDGRTEAVLVGLVLPALCWLHGRFLERRAVQAAIVLLLAITMGAHAAGGWLAAATVLVGVVLFGIAWAALSDFVALHTANSELTMVIGLFVTLPVLFLTSAFYPRQEQSAWLRAVERGNPAAYVIDAGRHLLTSGNDWASAIRTGAILALLLAVTLTAATAAFRHVTR